jgi:acetyl-CoA acetyltransferase
MTGVAIIGSGMVRFGRHASRSIKSLTEEAVRTALEDAGLEQHQLQAAVFANSAWGRNEGQTSIRGQVALRAMGIGAIPVLNVENACAGGSSALHTAILGVRAGAYDVALAVGAEKVDHPNRLFMLAGFLGGLDVSDLENVLAAYRREILAYPAPGPHARNTAEPDDSPPSTWRSMVHPFAQVKRLLDPLGQTKHATHLAQALIVLGTTLGWDKLRLLLRAWRDQHSDQAHSPFMDVYAVAARRHMKLYGTTQRHLAQIAAKNHLHGASNPLAQYQFALSTDQVLADKLVSYPLTRAMCAPIGDGAAATIVCSEGFVAQHGRRGAIRVRSSGLASGRDRTEHEADIAQRLAERAYAEASLEAKAIDLAELHDATAFGELHHTETLGFCTEGDGGNFAASGATALGGALPVNTSGGLECRGHPIAASGLAQIHELVLQLRGLAAGRQVAGARIGLAQNGGGAIGNEEAAMCIHILEAM